MAQPIEMISHVARQLILLETRFAQAPLEARREGSRLFLEIAKCLRNLETELEGEQPPFASCRQLTYLAARLTMTIPAGQGQATLEKLAGALSESCSPEKLVRQIQDSKDRNVDFSELSKAYILIGALADGLYLESR